MKLKHLDYGWVIVIIAAFILAAHALITYTFGIFIRPLTMEFNWDRGAISVAMSMYVLFHGLLAIFGGRLSDRYGPRPLVTISGLLQGTGFVLMSQVSSLGQVYLIWGLLMGVSGGSCFVPIISTVPRWFTRRRGIAVGLTVAGIGVGGVISAPLAQWLISSYGWQQAYVILGLIAFIIIVPLAQFMKHSPQRIELKPYGGNKTIDKQSLASTAEGLSFKKAIKTGRFWIFGLTLFFCFSAIVVILVHIVPYAVDIGISAIVAAGILSIIGGSSIIGRLSGGFISDRIGARPALTACLVVLTLVLIWLLFAQEIWMFYVFAVVFGIAYGGIVALQTLVSPELFGLGSLGTIVGGVVCLGTIGGAVGAPLAGSIFDVTGSYSSALLICVITGTLAIILSLILLRLRVGMTATK